MEHEYWMHYALELAHYAGTLGEVPVGAVLIYNDKMIATGYNRRELDKNGLAHAELQAIEDGCKRLGGWRLHNCKLYVTLEPCPMCAGAIINTRIPQVIFGAYDAKAGCLGSVTDFSKLNFNHHPEIISGVLEEESRLLLQDFFRSLRTKRKRKTLPSDREEK